MANILIIGCGYLGTALSHALIKEKHTVWALKRNTISTSLPDTAIKVSGDLTTYDYSELINNIDVIYYLASPDNYTPLAYQAIYVDGINHLLNYILKYCSEPPLIILSSSTSVYQFHDGRWVNEQTPINPQHFSEICIAQGEKLLQQSPVPSSVIRFGGIYGPGRTPFIDKIRQDNNLPTSDRRYTNRIHRDDCIGTLLHVLKLRDSNPLYLAVDSDPIRYNTLLLWLSTRLGFTLNNSSEAESIPEHSHHTNKRCSNDLLITSGYTLIYPSYLDGYEAILNTNT